MDQLLFPTPDNPLPDPSGERHLAGHFKTRDGKRLRYALFKADIAVARGTVVLLHGRNESIEKYFETIRDINALGLWVATFDWRGQGASERLVKERGHGFVRRFSDYETDLEDFLETVVLPDTRLPFFLVAHSTGALIALSAAPRLANRIERMVLSAPFVALGDLPISPRLLRLLTGILCRIGLGGRALVRPGQPRVFEGNTLTHDPARFARNGHIADTVPELSPSVPTARWINEAIKAMIRVRKPEHLAAIRIPTLILAAGADRIVPIRDIEQMGSFFRAGRVITIDKARHELFQELDIYREQVLAAIEAFLPGGEKRPAQAQGKRAAV